MIHDEGAGDQLRGTKGPLWPKPGFEVDDIIHEIKRHSRRGGRRPGQPGELGCPTTRKLAIKALDHRSGDTGDVEGDKSIEEARIGDGSPSPPGCGERPRHQVSEGSPTVGRESIHARR